MVAKISKYYHTLKYLRPIQFRYRAYYFVRARWRKLNGFKYPLIRKYAAKDKISLSLSLPQHPSYSPKNTFQFLHISHTFPEQIDWNYSNYGKLWTYNLNYFEFLEQENINTQEAKSLIYSFIDQPNLKDGLEPFPIALRLLNWVKFLVKHNISDAKIEEAMYAHAYILSDNIEYHLLGNHLLEDGFGLLFAAYYFQDNVLYQKAATILLAELEEQILSDGAHFELSPMYHQHILFRVLDSINIVANNPFQNQELLPLLSQKAAIMLGWLTQMTFPNGDIPMFNDSAPDIAPTSAQLFDYAQQLNIPTKMLPLRDSGYRRFTTDRLEMICDVGNVAPDYIPGHAHSDTFSFVLYMDGLPFIVDTGTSTYEANALRQKERGTAAHNTLMINGKEQTEVWGGFRVARRAKVQVIIDEKDCIEAYHDGYKENGAIHHRLFCLNSALNIGISDMVFSKSTVNCKVFIHLHPDVVVLNVDKHILQTNLAIIHFGDIDDLQISSYDYCLGFNKTVSASLISYTINATKRQKEYDERQKIAEKALNTQWYPLPVFYEEGEECVYDMLVMPNPVKEIALPNTKYTLTHNV